MKIILFGSTGMLGNYVYSILNKSFEIIAYTRNDFDILNDKWNKLKNIINKYEENDVIINCAGCIPQKVANTEFRKYIRINSLFPHKLQEYCNIRKLKLIHITTDCVFNGEKGNYNEDDIHDETNIYGVSKSLGEPENCTVIRTSIIGEEMFHKKSLLEWLRKQKNKTINGYVNHLWNGITCLTLAKIIYKTISKNLFWKGVKHIHSPKIVSKYDLCCYINEIYNFNITINQYNHRNYSNSSLTQNYQKINSNINCIKQQIMEQKQFKLISIGNYNNLKKCRLCNNQLNDIISFTMPLAGGFLKKKKDCLNEKIYPITLCFCKFCKTGQIKEVINEDFFFKDINNNNYFYYSSSIHYLCNHFKKLADKINDLNKNYIKLLEIGCNDGVLLNQINNHIKCIGIDPSQTIKNITNKNITTYNDFFNNKTAELILLKHGKMDIITSSNCLAHMNDINEIFKNIKKLLNDDGTVIIEVHYFKNIIDKLNFDFIYHEHMSYYTIHSFLQIAKKYGFTIINLEFIDIHGGSIRIFMNHYQNNNIYIIQKLEKYLDNENNIDTNLESLYKKITNWKNIIIDILNKEKNKNCKLYGYGASGRTNTILSFIDIEFDAIFDDSSYKINNYIPYYHTKILDSKEIYAFDIKTIFILAWPYSKDIIKKHRRFLDNGGKFIIILPKITIVTKNNYKDLFF